MGIILKVIILFFNPISSEISYPMSKNMIIIVLVSSFISAIYSVIVGKHLFLSVIVMIIALISPAIFALLYFITAMC